MLVTKSMSKRCDQLDTYQIEDINNTAQRIYKLAPIKDQSIFVTGATGLIGSTVVKTLLCYNKLYDAHLRIIAQIRNASKAEGIFDEAERAEITFVDSDIRKEINVSGKIDCIIHTANMTGSKFFVDNPVETIDIAIDGLKNVLRLALDKNCRKVVYLSSMEAFGITDPGKDLIKEEDLGYIDIHNVRSSYSEGKRMCELICACFAKEYGVNVTIARLAQTFGAGTPWTENRVFAQFAKSAIKKEDIILHTDGTSVGNYCYMTDAITALFVLLDRGENGQAYTVANEAATCTIKDMAALVADEIAGGEIKVCFDIPESALTYGYAPKSTMHLSSEKLRTLGWEPEIGLKEAYERVIAGMRETQ